MGESLGIICQGLLTCPDFQETVRTRVESEPPKLGSDTAGPEKLSVQETLPKLPSLPPHSQKITPAIIEANATQISGVQTLRDILYNAYDVRFEVRNDTPCLLYKEQDGFLSEYLRTRVMTLTRSMTWITFVPANELAISRETRMGILLFPSIMANVNSQLPLLTKHVLGLNRQITPIII